MKFLQLNFLPRSTDLALLLLRLCLGLAMGGLHGWGKLVNLVNGTAKFGDPIGIGQTPSLLLVILAEFAGALLLVLGLWTRLAALLLVVTMGVAFFVAHGARLSGPGNGELALVYLAGFAVLLLAGGGRFALDRRYGAKA